MSKEAKPAWDRFWIAVGHAAVALYVSHWLLVAADKLTALVPIQHALWGLAASVALGLVSLAIWVSGIAWAIDGAFAARALWRARNAQKHGTEGDP